ncbi:zinc finger BED domain-containing protein 1-like isoform X1 [Stegastes partitus]|uniref:Zinc finger BED domain-containing protein 1-like isoform X1 n=1 Tax=Stegastes partitus TaxID=144197 RepID=A0A9Y4MZE0_9TELE|nr:PREDICTED: zinc finger BED domain-containing protein 1-like isoform X1 [Stegastes partitus]XP_008276389.1 PREDICTED: zinc finger BED domain-containing protein 1-like isoform X1 [Stegastes partitus]XP_008276390.1 PREDICTED: zinc finger BED domain-containing protein 1-like isoform X1 [Stegastes partitus]
MRVKKKELQCTLTSAEDIVLTCELWSSRSEDSYLTVGCHFVDNLGSLKSYILKTTSLFGDESMPNILNQLLAITETWNVTDKVHSVVTAGMPQLKGNKTRWTHMPCFSDVLNAVFKDVMNNAELSYILNKCCNIIQFFKYDSEAEKKLTELQGKLQGKLQANQEELIMCCRDRWLTWLDMLQRLDKQYRFMVMVLNERGQTDLILNENEKKKIKNFISALEPLKKAISTMKGKGFETISVMVPVMMKLMDALGQEAKRKNDVAKMLLSKYKHEFGDVNNHKLATVTFLDPRYKKQLTDDNNRLAINKVMTELSAGIAYSTDRLKVQLDKYKAYPPNAEQSNPLAWWRHTGKEKFFELSKLAVKKLGVVSTAVPLERAFSRDGDQFCNLRSSIKPEHLNMVLFLNSNWAIQS